jgi:hypothetical protein
LRGAWDYSLVDAAMASSACDNFNLTQFQPSELEQCIKDMQFMNKVMQDTTDSQLRLLQLQLCNLATSLAQLKPIPEDELKSYCGMVEQAKKPAAKHAPQAK